MSNPELSERQRRFVEQPRIATLATVSADGAPHAVPVWYRYEAGAFIVLTEEMSVKARNVARDPRVVLCIDDRERVPYHTVIVHGRGRLEPAPGAAWREALAVHYLGEERGRQYVAQNADPNNIAIRITPERYAGW